MRLAAHQVLNANYLVIDLSLPGLVDVGREQGHQAVLDHVRFCQSSRTSGYLTRLATHATEYGPLPAYSMVNPIQLARKAA